MNVLIVEDHPIVCAGLEWLLGESFPGVGVRVTHDAAQALAALMDDSWDLVLLDISLPGGRSGLELLRQIHQHRPSLPVLMLTCHVEEHFAIRAFRAGAAGFITKDGNPEELLKAINKVMAGGRYMSEGFAEALVVALSRGEREPHELLSAREYEVFMLLVNGMALKEIAVELDISEKTVSTYRARLLEKMDMRSTAELVRYAIRAGLIS